MELFSEYVDELKLKDSEFVDSHWIRELKNEMLKMLAYVPELNDIKIMIEENSDISPENAPKENIKKGIETVGTVMKQDVISIVDLLHYIYCESNSDKVKEKNFYIEKYYNKVFFQTQQLILKDRRKMEEYKN